MMAGSHYIPPHRLLSDLGISEPRDIRIEAIAQHCGATVVYERLKGSAARILGFGDKAFITVDVESRRERQRFSAGHELGHWMLDRGKVASFACAETFFATEWDRDNPEKRANRFAANLLLPQFMFEPRAKNKDMTFETVTSLAREFETSLTATAIRLVELGSYPAMIVCNELGRRRWFMRGPDVPELLWPRETPGAYTCAYDLIHKSAKKEPATDVQADGWIDHPRSKYYSLREHSIVISTDLILSLLWWQDERQLLDLEEEESERENA